jgi:hypothetical protein
VLSACTPRRPLMSLWKSFASSSFFHSEIQRERERVLRTNPLQWSPSGSQSGRPIIHPWGTLLLSASQEKNKCPSIPTFPSSHALLHLLHPETDTPALSSLSLIPSILSFSSAPQQSDPTPLYYRPTRKYVVGKWRKYTTDVESEGVALQTRKRKVTRLVCCMRNMSSNNLSSSRNLFTELQNQFLYTLDHWTL